MDVNQWSLRGNEITISGYVENDNQLAYVRSAIDNFAVKGKVREMRPPKPVAKKTNFSYKFTTKRNVGEL